VSALVAASQPGAVADSKTSPFALAEGQAGHSRGSTHVPARESVLGTTAGTVLSAMLPRTKPASILPVQSSSAPTAVVDRNSPSGVAGKRPDDRNEVLDSLPRSAPGSDEHFELLQRKVAMSKRQEEAEVELARRKAKERERDGQRFDDERQRASSNNPPIASEPQSIEKDKREKILTLRSTDRSLAIPLALAASIAPAAISPQPWLTNGPQNQLNVATVQRRIIVQQTLQRSRGPEQ
jgi:hypothetical protein